MHVMRPISVTLGGTIWFRAEIGATPGVLCKISVWEEVECADKLLLTAAFIAHNDPPTMGKAQYKKKATARRHNPIRVPDAHLGGGKADGKANPEKEKQMLPVLQKVGWASGARGCRSTLPQQPRYSVLLLPPHGY